MLHIFVIDHADIHAVCVYFGSNSFFLYFKKLASVGKGGGGGGGRGQ